MIYRAAVGVCCAVILFLLPCQVHAQWQWIGPPGGLLGGFAQDPSNAGTLYAVAQVYPASVFKSTDHGQHWSRISTVTRGSRLHNPMHPEVVTTTSFAPAVSIS